MDRNQIKFLVMLPCHVSVEVVTVLLLLPSVNLYLVVGLIELLLKLVQFKPLLL
jgi:hypothetical protein